MTKPTFTKIKRRILHRMTTGEKGAMPAGRKTVVFNPNPNGKPSSALVSEGQIINWRKLEKRQARKRN